MRAFAVERFGDPPRILDLPTPTADDGYVVRVTVAGVNPVDYKLLNSLTAQSSFPFVVGVDFAGVLDVVPSSERELRPGDRVFGMARKHGSYAEHTAVSFGVKAEALARIPDTVADDQAAALPIAGITALGALNFSRLAAGQWLVVMGATGAVGGYAVQLARSLNARVIATVLHGADEAVRLGAEEVYDSSQVDVIDAVKRRHPEGVDAVLDIVSTPNAIRRDAEILKHDGRLVSTLYAADVAWFAERHIAAQNIASAENPFATREGLTELARLLAAGVLTARVTTTERLADAGALIERLRRGDVHGKAVIRI